MTYVGVKISSDRIMEKILSAPVVLVYLQAHFWNRNCEPIIDKCLSILGI